MHLFTLQKLTVQLALLHQTLWQSQAKRHQRKVLVKEIMPSTLFMLTATLEPLGIFSYKP
jgi:hypothetical protein